MHTVLYVEDEPGLLHLGKIFLERSGEFKVETAPDAGNALDVLKNRPVDCIISDYEMAGTSGIGLLKTLREQGDRIPFILFTGRGREQVVIEAINNGADFYLQKGGDPKSQFAELTHMIRLAIERSHTAKALQESENKYRSIVEQSLMGICLSRGNKVIFANRTLLRIFNFEDEEEFKKIPLLDHVAPSSKEKITQLAKKLVKEKLLASESEFEYDIVCKGGQIKTLHAAASLTELEGVVYVQTILQDITDRRIAERALRWSEARYRLISKYTADVIWTLDLTSQKFTYISPAVEKMWGYTADEVLDQTPAGFLTPASFEYATRTIKERIAQRQPGDTERVVFTMEIDMRRKDGSVVATEVVATMVIDEQRHPAEIIGISRDITDRKRVEDALRESEKKYRNLIENANEAIYVAQDGKLVLVNPRTTEMTGYSEEELLGKPFTEIVHPLDRDMLVARYEKRTRGEYAPPRYAFRLNPKDDRLVWVEISAVAIDWEGGPATLNFLVDITERRRAEEALLESEELYRTIFRTTGTGTVIIENDATISLVNPEFERMSGYTKDEIENKKKWTEFVDPEDLERMLAQHRLRRVDRSRALTRYEFRYRTRSGEIRDVSLVIDVIPGTTRSVASLLDITERKRAENELRNACEQITAREEELRANYELLAEDERMIRESEEKYRSLYDHLRDGSATVDAEGKITQCNAAFAAMLGYSAEELRHMTYDQITPARWHEAETGILRAQVETRGYSDLYEKEYRRKDGSVIPVEIQTYLIRDRENRKSGYWAIVRDMSEKRD
jgi:PAS domain S-box-containing protein